MRLDERPDAVLWDLDSTLSDTTQRRALLAKVKASEATWEDYSLAAVDDVPREAAVVLMRQLPFVHVVVSARSEVARDLTWDWIHRHQIPVSVLELRPDRENSENGEFKARVIERLREHFRPVLFIEDWAPASKVIRERTGIPVLTINPEYDDMCTCGGASGPI
jgi:hypothetical protein